MAPASPTVPSLRKLLRARRWPEALDVALEWWRRTRAPQLADLVTWLGGQVSTPVLRSRGVPPEAFDVAWHEHLRAFGTAGLPALLPSLLTKLPGRLLTFGPEADADTWERALRARLEALAALPADPRVAERLASFIADLEVDHSEATRAYLFAARTLAELADPRTVPALRRAALGQGIPRRHFRECFAAELPRSIARLEARLHDAAPLPASDRAALAALVPRAASTTVAPEVLFEQVVRSPTRLELRHVWADDLLGRGDPRGEFVALQLKALDGPLATAEEARVAALQRRHQRAWLGPLAEAFVPSSVRFRAGCIVEAQLAQGPSASADQWRRLAEEPSLSTLERLRRGTNAGLYARFLASPHLQRLEAIEVSDNPMLRQVVELPLAANVRRVTLERTLNAETVALLERLPRLEAIHLAERLGDTFRHDVLAGHALPTIIADGGW